MSIEPFDWFNRFFASRPFGRRNSLFEGFDEMRREMEREFEENLREIENKVPGDLVKEYVIEDGTKVKEIGPLVYGSTTTIGPDGKPIVREFGNVRPRRGAGVAPSILTERHPLSDVSSTEKEVMVTVELPGVSKEQIKIEANENQVDIKTEGPKRKYHEVIDLPTEVDIESVKSTFTNGLLEITFNKKSKEKTRSKSIRID
ncbi:MAG TPA: archaeal heat shock protein Hsp20 [Candidatus Nitrosocosmicus sp.]|jgi:HSP20 family protein|nr:archaeal heat shock protein Hsp20 [Candidatus Nitrosocosmicus sp.]